MAERQRRERREEPDEVEAAEERPKKGGIVGKFLIALVIIAVLAGGGLGGWMLFQDRLADQREMEEESRPIGVLWSMGTLIVNLLDDDGQRYLKVTIELELSSPEILDELDLLRPKIMDGILDLLSSKYYRDVVGFEGKQQLRDEIAMRINNYLSRGSISKVYFTDFVIQ